MSCHGTNWLVFDKYVQVLIRVTVDNTKPFLQSSKKFNNQRHAATLLEPGATTQLQLDKALYHKLQNLSSYPECLSQARGRLLELLDRTTYEATTIPVTTTSILSVASYSEDALHAFLDSAANSTAEKFAQYTARRKSGGNREMLPTLEYAEYWIRLAAPVKYVDGSWLGGTHRLSSTPDQHRAASRVAWQILSEELGDGDLSKNHVSVYEQLINETGNSAIGLGHEKRFVSNVHNPNQDQRVWTAALAQLLISLFPEEMLPEILGFNMAYESLPCHLLITIQELKELKLDPYYFILHVSIDNGHSGHAAMGAAAVTKYINGLRTQQEKDIAWKRVQAGYIMAEGLPTTPSPITELDEKVKTIFRDKCETSKPMHAFCKGNIGGGNGFGKTLTEWLDPQKFDDWGLVFVKTLAESRWVEKGSPPTSKLVQELQWGGRMFGAYTSDEVRTIEKWIKGLKTVDTFPYTEGAYRKFTGGNDILSIKLPTFSRPISPSASLTRSQQELRTVTELYKTQLPRTLAPLALNTLGSLLLYSAIPFEHFPSYPSHVSTPEGMAAIRTLRALYGFFPEDDLCAGMDEVLRLPGDVIGVAELGRRLGGKKPTELDPGHMLGGLCEYVATLSKFPVDELSRLLGCQVGFVACVLLNRSGLWDGIKSNEFSPKESAALEDIGSRVMGAWQDLLEASRIGENHIKWDEVVEGRNAVVFYITQLVQTTNEGVSHPSEVSRVGCTTSAVNLTDDIRVVYNVDGL